MTWRQGNVQSIGVDELSGAPVPMVEYSEDANGKMQERHYTLPADDPFFAPPNLSGIKPTEYKVLVKAKEVEAKTAGGIILPDEKKERDQYAQMEGVLVAASPLAFTYHDYWPEGAPRPAVGDNVLFAKYAGATVKGKDGQEYRLINDRDIAAVLE